jgi:WD40 repeat protein
MFARFVDDQRIIGAKKESFIQNFVWIPKAHDQNPSISFSLGSDKKSKFNSYEHVNGMDQIDRSSKRFDFPMTIISQGSHVAKGGYWDGKIVFSPVENASYYELNDHSTTVTAIACDRKDMTLISGTKSGEVIVWRNAKADCTFETAVNPWIKLRQINDHSRQVTSIFISDDMCLFATASTDGSLNIYNLWTAKLIRNFVQPHLLPIYSVVLAQSPLPICAYFTRDDHTWSSITINGE